MFVVHLSLTVIAPPLFAVTVLARLQVDLSEGVEGPPGEGKGVLEKGDAAELNLDLDWDGLGLRCGGNWWGTL